MAVSAASASSPKKSCVSAERLTLRDVAAVSVDTNGPSVVCMDLWIPSELISNLSKVVELTGRRETVPIWISLSYNLLDQTLLTYDSRSSHTLGTWSLHAQTTDGLR